MFASLLRMTTKYGFSEVHEQLVDGIKSAYPTELECLGAGMVLGEDVFGSPRPHPNAVLSLFAEQSIKFALPFATYRAAAYGMEVIQDGLAQHAHLAVWNMSPGGAVTRHAPLTLVPPL